MARVEEKIEALATYLGISPDDIRDNDFNMFETDEAEYFVGDEEEAREATYQDIEGLVDDLGLDAFTSSFKDWIIENALDEDFIDELFEDEIDNFVDNMSFDEVLERLLEIDAIEQETFDEIQEGGKIVDEDDYYEMLKDDYRDNFDEDRLQWVIDNLGDEWVEDSIKFAGPTNALDMDTIVDECIDEDGIAHFLARYDGEEIDLGNGLFAYRCN